jgi:hypothetical protein
MQKKLEKGPQKLWFKNKRWGYGWSPSTKQGWAVTVMYLISIYALAKVFASQGEELNLIFSLLVGFSVVVATLTLFFVSLRHAPKPKWQWGEEKTKE